jgi:hypothetical protein
MPNKLTAEKLNQLSTTYENVVRVMEHDAARAMEEDSRAYGGFIRATKGKMQEFLTQELIEAAWILELRQNPRRLAINKQKIRIPIRMEYVRSLEDESLREYVLANVRKYYYGLSVDKHVFIDGDMIMGIECKAYTENAMIKRILIDFQLLLTKVPNLICYLFQLESQLGGDYSSRIKAPRGSCPTHTLMSYFDDVNLHIVTLLPEDRKVDRPINKPEHFKPLPLDRLEAAVELLVGSFKAFAK